MSFLFFLFRTMKTHPSRRVRDANSRTSQRHITRAAAKSRSLSVGLSINPSVRLTLHLSPPARSKRSLEKKEEPVPSPSLAALQRTPKAEMPSRKRTFSQSSTSLSSGTGSGKEGSHSAKGSSTSKHRKGEEKGRSTRDGKVGDIFEERGRAVGGPTQSLKDIKKITKTTLSEFFLCHFSKALEKDIFLFIYIYIFCSF